MKRSGQEYETTQVSKKQRLDDYTLLFKPLTNDACIVMHIFSFLNGAHLLRKVCKPFHNFKLCTSHLIQFLFYKTQASNKTKIFYGSRFSCIKLSKTIGAYLNGLFGKSPILCTIVPILKLPVFKVDLPLQILPSAAVSRPHLECHISCIDEKVIANLKETNLNLTIRVSEQENLIEFLEKTQNGSVKSRTLNSYL